MARLDDETWSEIRGLYEAGISNSELERRYPVTRQAIIKRAAKEQWGHSLAGPVTQETIAQLHKETGGNFHSGEGRLKLIEAVGAGRAALIRRHQQEWVGLVRLRDDAIRIAEGKPPKFIKPDEVFFDESGKAVDENGKRIRDTIDKRITLSNKVLNLYDKAVNATMNAHEGERRSHGFDYKMQAESGQEDLEAKRKRFELINQIADSTPPSDAQAQSTVTPQEGPVIEGEVLP